MSSNFLVSQTLILSISRLKLLVSPSLHLPFSQSHFLNIHIILPILSSVSLPFHLPFSEPLLSSHSFNFLFTLNLSTLRTSILPVSLITLLSLSLHLSQCLLQLRHTTLASQHSIITTLSVFITGKLM